VGLESQLEDVKSARRELAQVIKAVDAEIVNVFVGAFADVSQNFAVGRSSAPQRGQPRGSCVPHSSQNRADGRFSITVYAGQYTVEFRPPSGLEQWAHGQELESQADVITVMPGYHGILNHRCGRGNRCHPQVADMHPGAARQFEIFGCTAVELQAGTRFCRVGQLYGVACLKKCFWVKCLPGQQVRRDCV